MADQVLSRKTLLRMTMRRSVWLTVATLSLAFAEPVFGQVREIAVENEVFRKTADGRRLADLGAGTSVAVIRSQGSWTSSLSRHRRLDRHYSSVRRIPMKSAPSRSA